MGYFFNAEIFSFKKDGIFCVFSKWQFAQNKQFLFIFFLRWRREFSVNFTITNTAEIRSF